MSHEFPSSSETSIVSLDELQSFVASLKEAKSDVGELGGGIRSYFDATTQQEAGEIQSSVFWLRIWSGALNFGGAGSIGMGYPSRDFMVRPYWLLGKNYTDTKNQQFLVAPASFPVHRGDIDTGNYVNFDTWSPVHRFLNDNYAGLYLFNPNSSHQVSLSKLGTKRFDVPVATSDKLPVRVDHKDKRAVVISSYARLAARQFVKVDTLSDEQLASFQVNSYTGGLQQFQAQR